MALCASCVGGRGARKGQLRIPTGAQTEPCPDAMLFISAVLWIHLGAEDVRGKVCDGKAVRAPSSKRGSHGEMPVICPVPPKRVWAQCVAKKKRAVRILCIRQAR